ncbi:MarR family winged helix-turn-helix transcriptional regulator [Cohnella boryungensis]|uniref:MarR family winged helix-turn-helix transcriptional regulator n=1 Tax=Cohnella boryungensis TaxID=768479 RepID=UPI00195D9163
MDKDHPLHGHIVINLFRCSNLLERIGRKLAAEAGLTSVHQWFILSALEAGDLSLKQLGQNTQVTKQNMTGMIERLKQGQFVATYEACGDKRMTLVRLTDKGREALARLERFEALSCATKVNRLCAEDLESFNRCLQQLVDNMNDG